MIVSAAEGQLEVVRLLLDSKADIHAADNVPQSARPPQCPAASSRPLHRAPSCVVPVCIRSSRVALPLFSTHSGLPYPMLQYFVAASLSFSLAFSLFTFCLSETLLALSFHLLYVNIGVCACALKNYNLSLNIFTLFLLFLTSFLPCSFSYFLYTYKHIYIYIKIYNAF
jgi:hypothetical protein